MTFQDLIKMRLRVEQMVVAAEKKRGREGYHAALDRLRVARAALLDAENKLNRIARADRG